MELRRVFKWYGIGMGLVAVYAATFAGGAGPRKETQKPAAERKAPGKGAAAMKMIVQSDVFAHGKAIPVRYTGEGSDVSPPLRWADAPPETKEFALIVDDPDAPVAEPWVHWVIYKIAADAKGLPEGVAPAPKPDKPAGALQGKNSFGKIGYGGPYPPKGHGVHHYRFKLYALKAPLSLQAGAEKKAVLTAMLGLILAQAEMVGTYRR